MATVSQALIDFVKSFEGPFIPKAKWDVEQYTYGFGTRARYKDEPITVPEAERQLRAELQESINRVLSIVKVPLNDNQLAALASLDFNSGSIIKYKKMVAALNSSNFNAAANEFLDINKAGGRVLPGLTRRRKAERELFLGKSSGVNNPISQTNQSIGSLAADAGQSIINGINSIGAGIKSALLTGQNCPPPAYTQQDRIIYPGCLGKSSNPIFGNSLGSGPSAPAINAIVTAGNRATGNSEPYSGELKPGGFVNPMKKGYTFTSKFGWRGGRMHNGVDLAAPMGTPIYASADGVVARMHNSCPATAQKGCGTSGFSGYGNIVYLKHQGAYTLYAHLSSVLVNQGETVKQGQLIGRVGDSGSSRGKHLHFETRLSNEMAVNPEQFIKF